MRHPQGRCEGCGLAKVRYTGRKRAATGAASVRRRTGDEIAVYRCPGSHGVWHVGHPIGWKRRNATKAAA